MRRSRRTKRFATPGRLSFLGLMPNTAELVKLPVADRLALVDELLASISDEDILLDSTQVNEARGRWKELKANPALGISYHELKARLG
jgi:putative addiction module component (TIGR02574 family)